MWEDGMKEMSKLTNTTYLTALDDEDDYFKIVIRIKLFVRMKNDKEMISVFNSVKFSSPD